MEVSNPRDDRAERNRGSAEVPLSTVIPRVGNFHLEQNTVLDSFSCTTTPKIWFISRFCIFFSLGENTWVRCNFITQAKSVAISVWCARKTFLAHQIEKSYILPHVRNSYLTLVISPRSHPAFKFSFFNTGCIGHHVISSLSAHVTMTSKRFKSKWGTPQF